MERRESLFARSPEEFAKQNIHILLRHRAESVSTYDQTVRATDLSSGSPVVFHYDRLLFATGASPVIPPIPGADLPGIHTLHGIGDADSIRARIENGAPVRSAAIIGGGFIGIEMAENLAHRGIAVTVFEAADRLMARLYDPDMSALIRAHMEEKGIAIRTGVTVERFAPGADGTVRTLFTGGTEHPCELAILATGVKPNVRLARDARIVIGPTGAIRTDSRMETSVRGVFAAGDCAETAHLVSGKPYWFPLGSTANKQGRVAGANIAGGRKIFEGVLGTSILKVFDKTAARTGLTTEEATDAGFNHVTATVTAPTHAGYFPGAGRIILTLVADRGSAVFWAHRHSGTRPPTSSSTPQRRPSREKYRSPRSRTSMYLIRRLTPPHSAPFWSRRSARKQAGIDVFPIGGVWRNDRRTPFKKLLTGTDTLW